MSEVKSSTHSELVLVGAGEVNLYELFHAASRRWHIGALQRPMSLQQPQSILQMLARRRKHGLLRRRHGMLLLLPVKPHKQPRARALPLLEPYHKSGRRGCSSGTRRRRQSSLEPILDTHTAVEGHAKYKYQVSSIKCMSTGIKYKYKYQASSV